MIRARIEHSRAALAVANSVAEITISHQESTKFGAAFHML